ncbi:MAG: phage tail tape measure protein, partial [Halobacteriota archaeon]|nr:phage tail tape measure protein [Halobacteriota archaeon]
MIGSLGTVAYDIIANDKTAQGLDSAGARAKKIQKAGLVAGAAMTGVGVSAKMMSDNINASYLTFDDSMAQVKSLGGLTNEQFETMKENAISMSTELPISASQVADGFYMMRSAGFDAAKVIEELPAVANMAVAGNMEMADAVSATTMVLDSYGDQAGSATDITNVLVGTVQGFKTTLPELQMQLSKNIGVAASLGISFEELAAMSGLLKKDFVGAEEAGTALKTMMLRLTDASKAEALEELGVSVKDANGNFV